MNLLNFLLTCTIFLCTFNEILLISDKNLKLDINKKDENFHKNDTTKAVDKKIINSLRRKIDDKIKNYKENYGSNKKHSKVENTLEKDTLEKKIKNVGTFSKTYVQDEKTIFLKEGEEDSKKKGELISKRHGHHHGHVNKIKNLPPQDEDINATIDNTEQQQPQPPPPKLENIPIEDNNNGSKIPRGKNHRLQKSQSFSPPMDDDKEVISITFANKNLLYHLNNEHDNGRWYSQNVGNERTHRPNVIGATASFGKKHSPINGDAYNQENIENYLEPTINAVNQKKPKHKGNLKNKNLNSVITFSTIVDNNDNENNSNLIEFSTEQGLQIINGTTINANQDFGYTLARNLENDSSTNIPRGESFEQIPLLQNTLPIKTKNSEMKKVIPQNLPPTIILKASLITKTKNSRYNTPEPNPFNELKNKKFRTRYGPSNNLGEQKILYVEKNIKPSPGTKYDETINKNLESQHQQRKNNLKILKESRKNQELEIESTTSKESEDDIVSRYLDSLSTKGKFKNLLSKICKEQEKQENQEKSSKEYFISNGNFYEIENTKKGDMVDIKLINADQVESTRPMNDFSSPRSINDYYGQAPKISNPVVVNEIPQIYAANYGNYVSTVKLSNRFRGQAVDFARTPNIDYEFLDNNRNHKTFQENDINNGYGPIDLKLLNNFGDSQEHLVSTAQFGKIHREYAQQYGGFENNMIQLGLYNQSFNIGNLQVNNVPNEYYLTSSFPIEQQMELKWKSFQTDNFEHKLKLNTFPTTGKIQIDDEEITIIPLQDYFVPQPKVNKKFDIEILKEEVDSDEKLNPTSAYLKKVGSYRTDLNYKNILLNNRGYGLLQNDMKLRNVEQEDISNTELPRNKKSPHNTFINDTNITPTSMYDKKVTITTVLNQPQVSKSFLKKKRIKIRKNRKNRNQNQNQNRTTTKPPSSLQTSIKEELSRINDISTKESTKFVTEIAESTTKIKIKQNRKPRSVVEVNNLNSKWKLFPHLSFGSYSQNHLNKSSRKKSINKDQFLLQDYGKNKNKLEDDPLPVKSEKRLRQLVYSSLENKIFPSNGIGNYTRPHRSTHPKDITITKDKTDENFLGNSLGKLKITEKPKIQGEMKMYIQKARPKAYVERYHENLQKIEESPLSSNEIEEIFVPNSNQSNKHLKVAKDKFKKENLTFEDDELTDLKFDNFFNKAFSSISTTKKSTTRPIDIFNVTKRMNKQPKKFLGNATNSFLKDNPHNTSENQKFLTNNSSSTSRRLSKIKDKENEKYNTSKHVNNLSTGQKIGNFLKENKKNTTATKKATTKPKETYVVTISLKISNNNSNIKNVSKMIKFKSFLKYNYQAKSTSGHQHNSSKTITTTTKNHSVATPYKFDKKPKHYHLQKGKDGIQNTSRNTTIHPHHGEISKSKMKNDTQPKKHNVNFKKDTGDELKHIKQIKSQWQNDLVELTPQNFSNSEEFQQPSISLESEDISTGIRRFDRNYGELPQQTNLAIKSINNEDIEDIQSRIRIRRSDRVYINEKTKGVEKFTSPPSNDRESAPRERRLIFEDNFKNYNKVTESTTAQSPENMTQTNKFEDVIPSLKNGNYSQKQYSLFENALNFQQLENFIANNSKDQKFSPSNIKISAQQNSALNLDQKLRQLHSISVKFIKNYAANPKEELTTTTTTKSWLTTRSRRGKKNKKLRNKFYKSTKGKLSLPSTSLMDSDEYLDESYPSSKFHFKQNMSKKRPTTTKIPKFFKKFLSHYAPTGWKLKPEKELDLQDAIPYPTSHPTFRYKTAATKMGKLVNEFLKLYSSTGQNITNLEVINNTEHKNSTKESNLYKKFLKLYSKSERFQKNSVSNEDKDITAVLESRIYPRVEREDVTTKKESKLFQKLIKLFSTTIQIEKTPTSTTPPLTENPTNFQNFNNLPKKGSKWYKELIKRYSDKFEKKTTFKMESKTFPIGRLKKLKEALISTGTNSIQTDSSTTMIKLLGFFQQIQNKISRNKNKNKNQSNVARKRENIGSRSFENIKSHLKKETENVFKSTKEDVDHKSTRNGATTKFEKDDYEIDSIDDNQTRTTSFAKQIEFGSLKNEEENSRNVGKDFWNKISKGSLSTDRIKSNFKKEKKQFHQTENIFISTKEGVGNRITRNGVTTQFETDNYGTHEEENSRNDGKDSWNKNSKESLSTERIKSNFKKEKEEFDQMENIFKSTKQGVGNEITRNGVTTKFEKDHYETHEEENSRSDGKDSWNKNSKGSLSTDRTKSNFKKEKEQSHQMENIFKSTKDGVGNIITRNGVTTKFETDYYETYTTKSIIDDLPTTKSTTKQIDFKSLINKEEISRNYSKDNSKGSSSIDFKKETQMSHQIENIFKSTKQWVKNEATHKFENDYEIFNATTPTSQTGLPVDRPKTTLNTTMMKFETFKKDEKNPKNETKVKSLNEENHELRKDIESSSKLINVKVLENEKSISTKLVNRTKRSDFKEEDSDEIEGNLPIQMRFDIFKNEIEVSGKENKNLVNEAPLAIDSSSKRFNVKVFENGKTVSTYDESGFISNLVKGFRKKRSDSKEKYDLEEENEVIEGNLPIQMLFDTFKNKLEITGEEVKNLANETLVENHHSSKRINVKLIVKTISTNEENGYMPNLTKSFRKKRYDFKDNDEERDDDAIEGMSLMKHFLNDIIIMDSNLETTVEIKENKEGVNLESSFTNRAFRKYRKRRNPYEDDINANKYYNSYVVPISYRRRLLEPRSYGNQRPRYVVRPPRRPVVIQRPPRRPVVIQRPPRRPVVVARPPRRPPIAYQPRPARVVQARPRSYWTPTYTYISIGIGILLVLIIVIAVLCVCCAELFNTCSKCCKRDVSRASVHDQKPIYQPPPQQYTQPIPQQYQQQPPYPAAQTPYPTTQPAYPTAQPPYPTAGVRYE